MITPAALLLAAVGFLPGDGWTAAGWMANPPAASPTPDPAPAPKPDPVVPPPTPQPTPDGPVGTPTRWQLADSAGQVWFHTDKAWLETWVAERNRSLVAPRVLLQVQPQYRSFAPVGFTCAGGRCGR